MQEKRRVPIDMIRLLDAMDDRSYESKWFLDLDTGQIYWRSEEADYDDFEELGIEDPDELNLVPIEPTESYEAYDDMVDFAETVEDEGLREKLAIALDGSGAFRRFKNVLLDYPEERQRWFEFSHRRDQERALEFLKALNIEPIEPEGETSEGEQ